MVVSDELRFADILSKSVDLQNSDRHKVWAQEIVSLLQSFTDSDPEEGTMIQYYLGSVLYAAGNYQGLAIKAKEYVSADALDGLYNVFKRDYYKVPASPDKYFMQSQKKVYEHFDDSDFGYSGPTSMGKSFIMQMFMKERIKSGEQGNFCILVPSKALINEVMHNVSAFTKRADLPEIVSSPTSPY